MNIRAREYDHTAQVARNLTTDTAYRLSFWVKVNDANTDIDVRLVSGHRSNIWVLDQRTIYDGAKVTVSKDTDEWVEKVIYFTSNVKGDGDTLYMVFNFHSSEISAYADALVDNVLLEEVAPPYVMFDTLNGEEAIFLKGKDGEKIKFPEAPKKFGSTFKGWYVDKACTEKFTATTFTEETGLTVYAGYSLNNSAIYTFENYGLKPNALSPGKYHMEDAKLKKAGSNVIEFDRTGKYNPGMSFVGIAHGTVQAQVQKGDVYIITYKYRLTKAVTGNLKMSWYAAHIDNFWAYRSELSSGLTVSMNEKTGVWKTVSLAVDTSNINVRDGVMDNAVYLGITGGKGGILQIDDVKITRVPKGQCIAVVNTGGCSSIPDMFIGKEGTDFSKKLPKNPEVKGMKFVGYFTKDASQKYVLLTEENMKLRKEPLNIYARFFNEKVGQNFDGEDFKNAVDSMDGFTVFDFDYEHYDSQSSGNSKDNVTSGRYSLHRKGESRHVEGSVILTLGNNISETSRYTVTMKVKLGKHLHTDGAIKIVSGRSYLYPWTWTGDFYPVVPIADLKEGEWVEVSYTFNSVEGFVTLTTPGYCELFIDDVVFTLVDEKTPLSTPKEYTEYVTVPRDENGNVLGIVNKPIDIDTIIDESLGKGAPIVLYVAIGAGALLIIAAVVLLIVLKKKKA